MSVLSSSAPRAGLSRAEADRVLGKWLPGGDSGPRRGLLLAFCVIFGAAIFVLRMSTGGLQDATLLLYTIPIALIAIEFGLWPGLLTAGVSLGLFGLYVAIKGPDPGFVGWLSRSVAWLVAGGVIGASSDRLRAALRATQQLNDALEESNADLREFTYILSHDLTEPLRSISGFAQFLDEEYGDGLDQQGRRYIQHVLDGATRMRALIADVLDFSRAARDLYSPGDVDLEELVDLVLEQLSAAVRERGAVIVRGSLPRVRADEVQLAVVLQNLLSNALKFNDATPPRIEIKSERIGDFWRIAVIDNGIGISPGHADRVFGLFQRLHTREAYEGTGLGLAISKRIVERHGGRIGTEPAPDGGSCFWFTIPDPADGVS